MSYRNAAGNVKKAPEALIFRRLRQVNKLREAKLRKQLTLFDQHQQTLLSEMEHCRQDHASVTARLRTLLNWQGTSSCQALLDKKCEMSQLAIYQHKLLSMQHQLQENQQLLADQRGELQKNLRNILKKNEKIDRVLANEHHQG